MGYRGVFGTCVRIPGYIFVHDKIYSQDVGHEWDEFEGNGQNDWGHGGKGNNDWQGGNDWSNGDWSNGDWSNNGHDDGSSNDWSNNGGQGGNSGQGGHSGKGGHNG